jgi:hypothetical protein
MFVPRGRERHSASKTWTIKDQRGGGQAGSLDDVLQIIEKEVLDALVDGAQVTGEGPVFFATEGEEVSHQLAETIVREGDARLGNLAKLEIQVRKEARVGGGRR